MKRAWKNSGRCEGHPLEMVTIPHQNVNSPPPHDLRAENLKGVQLSSPEMVTIPPHPQNVNAPPTDLHTQCAKNFQGF